MSMFDHWQTQRDLLRPRLKELDSTAEVVHQVRRALLQTEQNALAEMSDDVLRQQAGVLMGCVKQSIGLMEAQIAAQVWVPQKHKASGGKERLFLMLVSGALAAAVALYCSFKGWVLGAALAACALIIGGVAFVWRFSSALPKEDETRVTLRPDVDRLFAVLDGQIRSLDRYVDDFSYLNDQLRSNSSSADEVALHRAADLMEALYECGENERAATEEAANRLLAALGLRAVDYSDKTSRFFNTLPSKSVTRTLSPAILSMQDERLLRRGTAAVRMDNATSH